MTLFLHEIRRNRLSICIWSAAISVLLAVCVLIYPEMSKQMADIENIFVQMGSFSDAFGISDVSIGEFMGYFAIECGETLGLGGAIFASILGAGILSKEERGHTADLLLTHPISRVRVVTEKLLAAASQIAILNIAIIVLTSLSVLMIGEKVDIKIMALIFLSYFILQTEIAVISFCISAFVGKGSTGIGIGVAAILTDKALNIKYLAVGIIFMAIGITAAFIKYRKKDIK